VSDDHAALPVTLPSLDFLTDTELGALRSKFSLAAREARRKANQVIQRTESLKKPFGRALSVHKGTSPEEREEAFRAFERELLRVPEAFLAHAYANSLVLLDTACREAMSKRALPLSKKKGPSPPVASTSPKPPTVPEPPATVKSLVGEEALAAMFDQADEDDLV
jgi:hypothetical protein